MDQPILNSKRTPFEPDGKKAWHDSESDIIDVDNFTMGNRDLRSSEVDQYRPFKNEGGERSNSIGKHLPLI